MKLVQIRRCPSRAAWPRREQRIQWQRLLPAPPPPKPSPPSLNSSCSLTILLEGGKPRAQLCWGGRWVATRWLTSQRGERFWALPPSLVIVQIQNGAWRAVGEEGTENSGGGDCLLLCPWATCWLVPQLPNSAPSLTPACSKKLQSQVVVLLSTGALRTVLGPAPTRFLDSMSVTPRASGTFVPLALYSSGLGSQPSILLHCSPFHLP